MKIRIICMGETRETYLKQALEQYQKRINSYIKFRIDYISSPKSFARMQGKVLMKKEEELFLKQISNQDHVILLDENGKQFDSMGFSKLIQDKMNISTKSLAFVVGGAFGFSDGMKQKFPNKISLSKMTFSHQMIRLLFVEQLYRVFTIINNHPYHNS